MSSSYDHSKRNAIGFGGGSDKMITLDLWNYITSPVKGVVCSDNFDYKR